MRTVYFAFCLLIAAPGFSQRKLNLEDYYPEASTPPVVIYVLVHVMQYRENEPRNYTQHDTALIRKQFDLINRFYSQLGPPTLKPPRPDVPFIPDSRIRFKIENYAFHINEKHWDRKWLGWGEKNPVDSVIPEKNEFLFRPNRAAIYSRRDSIVVLESDNNNGNYTFVKAYWDGKYTHLEVKEKIHPSVRKGKISYRFGEDNNCSDDLFEIYGKDNDSVLHVFLTGASYNNIGFGCGPSFQYFNMTNMWPDNNWAGAQLMAHELGHCLGLGHTNYPQFDDLPKTDRFGWIDCDTIDVSNNIMGYNKCRNYLSPKQIAWVHYQYATDVKRIRTTRNHRYHAGREYYSGRGRNEWNRNQVLQGDLVVRKNSHLIIRGTVHLPAGARIYIEQNATLEIDGGTVTNHTGGKWKGIVYCKKYGKSGTPKKKGKLILTNGGKTENHLNEH